MYHVKRIRQIEGEKIILDEDYLNKSIVEGLSYQDAENSLYEYIEKELGLKISFASKKRNNYSKGNRRRKTIIRYA